MNEASRNMSDGLSVRQTHILKNLIDEYIETAIPVGSEVLEKKYSLGVSPATIRNEMSELTDLGYLKQPHTSAGRIPTPKAMKFYISQLMEEKQMSLTDEVKAKEEVWDVRDNIDELMAEATHALAQRTQNLAIGALPDENKIWHSGYANIFHSPEFANVALCTEIFSMIEEVDRINEIFFQKEYTSPIDVFFGEELGWSHMMPVGVIATRMNIRGKNAALGIIGPSRISYQRVIPIIRYYGNLIQEIANR